MSDWPRKPKTDGEVEALLKEYLSDPFIVENLIGIYRVRRALGETVEEALDHVLEVYKHTLIKKVGEWIK